MQFILFFLIIPSLYANDAVIAYKNQNYQKAITIWEKDLKSNKLDKSTLLFNIGNGYFKQKKYVEAILLYHKSLKINFNNSKVKTNLILATEKQKITDLSFQNEFYIFLKRITYLFQMQHLQWIIIICIWGIIGLLTFKRFKPIPNYRTFIGIFLIILITASINLYGLYHFQNTKNEGILKEQSVGYEDLNLTNSKKVFKGGEHIEILDQLKQSSQIKTDEGQYLWISNSAIYKI
jgi:tetratricopeptide (TPR) repeat protein